MRPAERTPAGVGPRALLVALALVVGLGIAALTAAHPAVAQNSTVTAAEVAELARRAATDDGALAELRAVTEVDGQPVDLASATADLGSARAERLDGLAQAFDGGAREGATTAADPGADRRAARDVLDDDKYRERSVPKPFQGLLGWLADRLRPVGRLFEPILDLPGGPYLLGAALVALGTGAIVFVTSRRTGAAVAAATAGRLVDPALDPGDLGRRADAAEEAGDGLGAVRLRYQAGLLRLAREGRLVLRADTTAAGAARQVDHPVLDELTADFEAVVYGDRPATAEVLARSRQGWADVLGARSRR